MMRYVERIHQQYLLLKIISLIYLLMIVNKKFVSLINQFVIRENLNHFLNQLQLLNIVFFIVVYAVILFFMFRIKQIIILVSHHQFYFMKLNQMKMKIHLMFHILVNMDLVMIHVQVLSYPQNNHYHSTNAVNQYQVK